MFSYCSLKTKHIFWCSFTHWKHFSGRNTSLLLFWSRLVTGNGMCSVSLTVTTIFHQRCTYRLKQWSFLPFVDGVSVWNMAGSTLMKSERGQVSLFHIPEGPAPSLWGGTTYWASSQSSRKVFSVIQVMIILSAVSQATGLSPLIQEASSLLTN